jgi:hypothetical protein
MLPDAAIFHEAIFKEYFLSCQDVFSCVPDNLVRYGWRVIVGFEGNIDKDGKTYDDGKDGSMFLPGEKDHNDRCHNLPSLSQPVWF